MYTTTRSCNFLAARQLFQPCFVFLQTREKNKLLKFSAIKVWSTRACRAIISLFSSRHRVINSNLSPWQVFMHSILRCLNCLWRINKKAWPVSPNCSNVSLPCRNMASTVVMKDSTETALFH